MPHYLLYQNKFFLLYKIQDNVKNIYMKVLLVIFVLLILFLICSIRLKVYKVNNEEIRVNIIVSKSLKIKIDLTKYISKKINSYIYNTSSEKKVYDIKQSIETFRYHKDLVKSMIHIFNGNTVYLSVNSFYYLDNLSLYLALYYLYSYIQNQLYINLHKVKSTCFKTRIKNISLKTEINIDLETYVFKLIFLFIKRRKELLKLKEDYNEQPSNNRAIKNIYGKY